MNAIQTHVDMCKRYGLTVSTSQNSTTQNQINAAVNANK